MENSWRVDWKANKLWSVKIKRLNNNKNMKAAYLFLGKYGYHLSGVLSGAGG